MRISQALRRSAAFMLYAIDLSIVRSFSRQLRPDSRLDFEARFTYVAARDVPAILLAALFALAALLADQDGTHGPWQSHLSGLQYVLQAAPGDLTPSASQWSCAVRSQSQ